MDWTVLREIVLPLIVAALLGGLVGLEREVSGHWAGLRTHMMVAMGAVILTLGGHHAALHLRGDVTRVIQGIAVGVGFIGGGTIIKLTERREVKGLTTASSIWVAAGLGVAVGLDMYVLAVAATLVTLMVLAVFGRIERHLQAKFHKRGKDVSADSGNGTDARQAPSIERSPDVDE